MELCWLNPSRRSNTLRIFFRRELDSMKALQGSIPHGQGCFPALGIRNPKAEGQGHSPGLLQAMQAEGDTTCGLCAEPKAAQTVSLWHTIRQHQVSAGSRPQTPCSLPFLSPFLERTVPLEKPHSSTQTPSPQGSHWAPNHKAGNIPTSLRISFLSIFPPLVTEASVMG